MHPIRNGLKKFRNKEKKGKGRQVENDDDEDKQDYVSFFLLIIYL
jgi:hypothetical protein